MDAVDDAQPALFLRTTPVLAPPRELRSEPLESHRRRRPQSPLVPPPSLWTICLLAGIACTSPPPHVRPPSDAAAQHASAPLDATQAPRTQSGPEATASGDAATPAATTEAATREAATAPAAASQRASTPDASAQRAAARDGATQDAAPHDAASATPPEPRPAPALVIDRGAGEVPLVIPRDEELEFVVHVEYGPISNDLGHVWLKSGVKPYRASLIVPKGDDAAAAVPKETGWIQARAKGGNFAYESDTTLTAWHLPQVWPRLRFLHEQRGTEERTFELLLGSKEGDVRASLRRDTDKGAPRGTRIWKEPTERKVPAAAIDMVSAGYLSRQLFSGGLDEIKTTLIDKHKIWDVRMKKGRRVAVHVDAGRFDAYELEMTTTRPPSEPPPKRPEDAHFEGPFGIHGNLRILLEASTGVPLRFEGTVPLGILGDLHAEIRLVKYRGTPAGFAPKGTPAAGGSAR